MPQSNNKQELKKLTKLWYGKLKENGFMDIEKVNYSNPSFAYLTSWTSTSMRNTRKRYEIEQEYYRIAEHFLNNYKFESTYDNFVWEHHSNKVSIRNILALLKEQGIKSSKDTIGNTIKRLKVLMLEFVRTYDQD